MKFFNKLKWILGIVIVFVIIITTNLIDKNNFERVESSVESIYSDRLIAYDLIYKISEIRQEKELAIHKLDTNFFQGRNKKLNESFTNKLIEFEDTRLADKEAEVFERLKANFEDLLQVEKDLSMQIESSKDSYLSVLARIDADLKDLSEIQILEGNKQRSISRKAMDAVELFTHLEIYVLIFLAIVIQILILYDPNK